MSRPLVSSMSSIAIQTSHMKRSGLETWTESVWKCCWVPIGKFSVWEGQAWQP